MHLCHFNLHDMQNYIIAENNFKRLLFFGATDTGMGLYSCTGTQEEKFSSKTGTEKKQQNCYCNANNVYLWSVKQPF